MGEKGITEMRDEVRRYLEYAEETMIRKFYEFIEKEDAEGWWNTLPVTVKKT